MSSMINLVIIGTGDIARKRHIPGILQSADAKLYGFYNRSVKKSEEAAKTYGGKAFASEEEIYADPAVDAVLISTPPVSHKALAVKALLAGRHVLLEKPMSLTVEEAEAMKEASEKTGAKLMLLHVQRFYEPHRKAKELLEQGEIGRLLSIRTFLGNGDADPEASVAVPGWQDVLFNVAIHRIDLIRYLVGSEVSQVFCHRSSLLGIVCPEDGQKEEDHMVGLFRFENGVMGTMISARTSYGGEDRSTVLLGTKGTITTYLDGHGLVLEKRNGERRVYDLEEGKNQKILELTDIHEQFCRCIEEDTEPAVTAKDGVESVKIAVAMERSDREKRWVGLEEV